MDRRVFLTSIPAVVAAGCTGGTNVESTNKSTGSGGESTVATPSFTPAGGSYTSTQMVMISSPTPGAAIYYTTGGSTPTTSSSVYSGPIAVSNTQTLRAIGAASGMSTSAVGSASYTISVESTVATPTFAPAGGSYASAQTVTISSATAGAKIYYTKDGSAPTTNSAAYTAPIAVSSTETIKAIGAASGMTTSAVGTASYTINAQPVVAVPTFSPPGGSYPAAQTVAMSSLTTGATIHYTLDGSAPTTSSATYTAPIAVSSTETIKAIGTASGMSTSAVGTAVYTIGSSNAAGYDGALSINAAGQIVNGHGNPIMLRGVNVTGLEGQLAANASSGAGWSWNPWGNMSADGGSPTNLNGPNMVAIANWKCNFIRITMNAQSFLNVKNGVLGGSQASPVWTSTYSADPKNLYKQSLLQAILNARKSNLYMLVNFHCSAPAFTFGGTTAYLPGFNQPPFMDYDTGSLYWTDPSQSLIAWLATNFGSASFNAAFNGGQGINGGEAGAYYSSSHGGATGIQDFIFELFNEPYLNDQAWTLTKLNADGSDSGVPCPSTAGVTGGNLKFVPNSFYAMLNGGWCNWMYLQGSGIPSSFKSPANTNPASSGGMANALAQPWRIFGYQAALNGIRALGATNIIQVNSGQWANSQQSLFAFIPTDTVSPPQISTGYHCYPSAYNSSTSVPYNSDGGPTWHSYADQLVAGTLTGIGRVVPIIIDEWGDVSGKSVMATSQYDQQIQNWIDGAPLGTAHAAHFNWTGPNSASSTGSYEWCMTVKSAPVSCTGSISAGVLTVTAVTGTPIVPGMVLDSGYPNPNNQGFGTWIQSQLTGTTGGVGTYQLSFSGGSTSGTITMIYPEPYNGDGTTYYNWVYNHA
jgi:Chitobiase/beta-hexosaminidase C-terminal domain